MIKIFDIVFKIEELSQIELKTVPDYENGVYIKVLNKYVFLYQTSLLFLLRLQRYLLF